MRTALLIMLMTVSVCGQYADKVKAYFEKRSCLPSTTRAYTHTWNDWENWSGFHNELPIVVPLDSEGIERMCDWAGRQLAHRLEEYVFVRTLYLMNNYSPVVLPSYMLDWAMDSGYPAQLKKAVIIPRQLLQRIRLKPNYLLAESMPLDHHYTGKSQYMGFLWGNVGVFTALGLPYAVVMNTGDIEFELNVTVASFQGGYLVLDYECYSRPVTGAVITFYHPN